MHFGDAAIARVLETRVAYEPTFLFKALPPDHIERVSADLPAWSVEPVSNRIFLSFQSFVIRHGGQTILVDTCNGNDKCRTGMPRWSHCSFPFLENLAKVGVTPEDVDLVMCSHLHADHVGWNTRLVDGRWVPTFPNARYLVSDVEMAHWRSLASTAQAHPINHGAWDDSVLPIEAAGLLDVVRVDHELSCSAHSRIRLEHAPGHTPGHVHLVIDKQEGQLIYSADTLHHPLQIADPSYALTDWDDDLALAGRKGLIQRCVETGAILLPAHFGSAGVIERKGQRTLFSEV